MVPHKQTALWCLVFATLIACANGKEVWEFDNEFDEAKAKISLEEKDGVLRIDEMTVEILQEEKKDFLFVGMFVGPDYKAEASKALTGAAKQLKDKGITGTLALIDGSFGVAQAYGVNVRLLAQGPVFMVVENGQAHHYPWSSTADDIATFVTRKQSPACQALDDSGAIEKFVKEHAKAAVAFYQGVAFDAYAKFESFIFPQALNALHVPCGIVKSPGAAGKYKLDSDSVTVFANGQHVSKPTKELAGNGVSEFITAYARPPVLHWGTTPQFEQFAVPDYEHIYLLANTKSHSAQVKAFTAAAEKNVKAAADDARRAKVVFVVIPAEGNEDLVWNDFWVEPEGLPTLRYRKPSAGKGGGEDASAMYESAISDEASVSKFVGECLKGTATKSPPTIQSEKPRPGFAPDEGSSIKFVTAKDFFDFTGREGVDVMLEFYAPWCGHCKKIAPEYETLAKEFGAIESVDFGKIDGTKNDIAKLNLQVTGYPTFILFPAQDKTKAMRLRAQASLPVLTDFIRTEAHVKFELGGYSYGKGVAPNLRSQVSDDEFDEL